MSDTFALAEVLGAMRRAAAALRANADALTALDQAVGDGDLGVTATKTGEALEAFAATTTETDLGKLLGAAGMAVNRTAPSTMGTLMATVLMRAGRAVAGKQALAPDDLARMLAAAEAGVRERGKAQLGDKTLLDVLHPAAETLAAALAEGAGLPAAGRRTLAAAREARERVTPLRNRIGRASWLGERSEGKPDPGCALAVLVLEAIADTPV